MIDMTETIEAKSDQLNAIDLIGGPIQVKLTAVKKVAGDQPISINYENDNGKPWKPCKNMRRVMVKVWGKDAEAYAGRSLVLFNDPNVKWAGKEQGGIRISHMSDMEKDNERITLQESRGKVVNWLVKALLMGAKTVLSPETLEAWGQEIANATTMADLQSTGVRIKSNNYDPAGSDAIRPLYTAAQERIRADVDPKNSEFPPEQ